MTQTTKPKSAVYGWGVYGSKIFGEDYAPLPAVVDEDVIIQEMPPVTTIISWDGTPPETFSITETDSEVISGITNENFPITETETTELDFLVPIPPETFWITETDATEIGTTESDIFGATETETDSYPAIDEIFNIIETVLCEMSLSLSEVVTIMEMPRTEIGCSASDIASITESLETLYGLTIAEIITIVESVLSQGSFLPPCARLTCALSYPKTVALVCTLDYPKDCNLNCKLICG